METIDWSSFKITSTANTEGMRRHLEMTAHEMVRLQQALDSLKGEVNAPPSDREIREAIASIKRAAA